MLLYLVLCLRCWLLTREAIASLLNIAVLLNLVLLKYGVVGSVIRIAGRLAKDGDRIWLTSSDGGSVQILGLADSGVEGCFGSLVEVVGIKSGDALLNAVGVVVLGEEFDAELWDEAIKVLNLPFFQ